MDKAHRALVVSIVVIELTPPDAPRPHFQWIASDFLALWNGHVEDEEALLTAVGDPAGAAHRADHAEMRRRLKVHLNALTERSATPGQVAADLHRWFHEHTSFFDRSLGVRVRQSSPPPPGGGAVSWYRE